MPRICCALWHRRFSASSVATATSTSPRTPCRSRCWPPPVSGGSRHSLTIRSSASVALSPSHGPRTLAGAALPPADRRRQPARKRSPAARRSGPPARDDGEPRCRPRRLPDGRPARDQPSSASIPECPGGPNRARQQPTPGLTHRHPVLRIIAATAADSLAWQLVSLHDDHVAEKRSQPSASCCGQCHSVHRLRSSVQRIWRG
jgi:hypothetical protein